MRLHKVFGHAICQCWQSNMFKKKRLLHYTLEKLSQNSSIKVCKYNESNKIAILDSSDNYSKLKKLLTTTKNLSKSKTIEKCSNITKKNSFTSCMGNLLSLGAKMCIWNLTEGRSRNCDFKCKLCTYFCGFGLYSCNAILHAMCFQFCLHRISIKNVYLY